MSAAQLCNPMLRVGVEAIVGIRDVDEERAAERSSLLVVRHLFRVQDGESGRLSHEAQISVPIVAGIRATDIAAVFLDVRDYVNPRIPWERVLLAHVHLELSKPFGKADLRLR